MCVTLAPASISHFTSSGGKQFCNDVDILLSIKFKFKFKGSHVCVLVCNLQPVYF